MSSAKELKREILIDVVKDFNKKYHDETDEQKKKEMLYEVLTELEGILNTYDCQNDIRFYTYGRRDFLRKEFSLILQEKKWYSKNNDYLIGAYYNLYDYIICDTWISIPTSSNKSFVDMIKEQDNEYREQGIICEKERYILLDMIYELKDIIKNGDKTEITKKMNLFVEESMWSGWSRDYEHEIINHKYEIKLNEKYVVKASRCSYLKDGKIVDEISESFAFFIEVIGNDFIIIKTNISMNCPLGVNLSTDGKRFKIKINQPIQLTTPTKDVIYKYKFLLE